MGLIGQDSKLRGVLCYKGERGYSAYQVACMNGFIGTERDWLAQLGTSSHFTEDKIVITSVSGQTSFDLPSTYVTGSLADVYINGFKLNSNEYTIDTETRKIKLIGITLEEGAIVEIVVKLMSTNDIRIKQHNSISNMKADSTLKVADFVTTTGYYATNDGGGADYLIREKADNDVEDNGFIHFLENGLVAELIIEDKVNVKQFGAKGDGVTDDTKAIQEAINKVNVVCFAEGTYLLNSSVEILNSCKLIGEKAVITGFGFIGKTNPSLDIHISNIEFKDIKQNAINIENSNLVVENCKFVNIGTSQSLDVTYQGSGIYIKDNFKLTVKNSYFNLCRGHGAIFTVGKGYVDITENYFDDNLYRAINVYAPTREEVLTGTIAHNHIQDCGKSNTTGSAIGCNGIYSINASEVILSHNTIINSRENAIEGSFKIIDSNYIDGTNVEIENKTTPSVEGIYLWKDCDVIVSNNYLKNVKRRGITLGSLETETNCKVLVQNNIIDEIERYEGEAYSIYFLSNVGVSNKTIANNVVSNEIYLYKSSQNNTYIGDLRCINIPNSNFNKMLTPNYVYSFTHNFKDIEPFTYSNCTPTIVTSDIINKKVVRVDYQQYNRLVSPILPYSTRSRIAMKIGCRGHFDIQVYKNNEYLMTLKTVETDEFTEFNIRNLFEKSVIDDITIWFIPKTNKYLEIASLSYNVIYE